MLASIFTPTHQPQHLLQAYLSLCEQSHGDWEWIVVPNGDAVVPQAIANDPRVKIHPAGAVSKPSVGFLKRLACDCCVGQVLVELDHDDRLAPNALEAILGAAAKGAEFVYSDFVQFNPDGSSHVFDETHGWESYPAGEFTAMRAFEPCPRSLHEINYAPNHVRAWTSEAYSKAGGHDPSLAVADDLDLVARTYLAGVEFAHVGEPLYFYREHGGVTGNTYRVLAPQLSELRQEVQNRHTYPLVKEWCRRAGLRMLDLGPKADCPEGFEAVEFTDRRNFGQKVPLPYTFDGSLAVPYEQPLPALGGEWYAPYGAPMVVAPNSVGHLRLVDVLPQLLPCNIAAFFSWAYRVLAPGGWLTMSVASTDGRGAFMNPLARSYWNANSFWCLTHPKYQAPFLGMPGCPYGTKPPQFQSARAWDSFPTPWHETNKIPYTHIDLVAVKGQRVPGGHYFS